MKGNTINEFMNDLYINGGPEKEFKYMDKYYIIQCESDKISTYLRLDVYKLKDDDAGDYIQTFSFRGSDLNECVKSFEQANVFDDKTIYEAEKDIVVLFG